jgi:hypothetical protein
MSSVVLGPRPEKSSTCGLTEITGQCNRANMMYGDMRAAAV